MPLCPVTGRVMRFWQRVPVDCLKGEVCEFGKIYRSDQIDYCRVHPLPTIEECAESYALDDYYTHGKSHFVENSKTTFLDRIRQHIAWRLDRGQALDAQLVDRTLDGPSQICDVGCGSGDLALSLAGLSHTVTGVEIDPNALARECDGKI